MSRARVWLRGVVAVALRELRSMLVTPLGWCLMAAVAVLAGSVFALAVFKSGAPTTLRAVAIALGWAVLATAPALSMRSVAEERRNGTWAGLCAAPGGVSAALFGKAAAAKFFLLMCIAVPLAAQLAALEMFARPDYGEAFTALVGLVLAGSAYLASGLLMSALTGNQVGAYLLTLFFWLVWIVVAKAVPALLPAKAAYIAFALDPLRRLDDFLLGVLDSASIVFFAVIGMWFTFAAVIVAARPLQPASRAGAARAVVALLAAAVLALGVIGTAESPACRASWDMTKTRAYTLSAPTAELVGALDGQWRVAVVLDSASADPAVMRQVDEVLRRMAAASKGHLTAQRIDPSDANDAVAFEGLLETVQARDSAALAVHGVAIAAGLEAFSGLVKAASDQTQQMGQLLAVLPENDPDRAQLDSLRGAFAQLVAQRQNFERSIAALRLTSQARPFPDEARAAAAIAANLSYWGEQLQAAARAFSARQRDPVNHPALGAWLQDAVPHFMSVAQRLRAAQDGLERLPKLHGSDVGAALAKGDAAVVIGPPGVAVIPGAQLVAGASERGAISFDRRFRGEQLLAAAIRGMGTDAPPVAVFMHAGGPGMLAPRADHGDFSAAADALRSARVDVAEWTPGEAAEPVAPKGRKIVWIVVPPLDRDGVRDNPRERALLAAAERIAARGDPILLAVGPSLLPILGQRDPWAELLAARGLRADTGRSVLQVVPMGPGKARTVAEQEVREFNTQHIVGGAVDGQLARFDRVVPVNVDGNARAATLAAIEPAAERWIETDWRRDQRTRTEAPEGKALPAPVPVVVAVEGTSARTIVVGSPVWLISSIADMADSLGGGRVALRYPGNRELLVNAVAWLGGRDDLVASAGAGREVDRLPTLSAGARTAVQVVESIGVPAAIAGLGAIVLVRRRLRT